MNRQGGHKKVFVGLSGGVDSSVSALLLSAKGGSALGGKGVQYDVTGVFIRVWQPDFFDCTWKDDRLDAMRVAAKLGIPFRELDLEKEYKKEVVDYMIAEYKAGKTPNPDVMCNRFIKFGGFYDWARAQGADFIATGHYARIKKIQDSRPNAAGGQARFKIQEKRKTRLGSSLRTTNYVLRTASDSQKDQSYFLWQIRKEQLPHILFPVGGMKKTAVRKLARESKLVTADKKDSQGLCFVGKVDMKEFLRHFIKEKKGKVIDEGGDVIGEHNGAFFYTLGERFGLPLSLRGGRRGSAQPYFVISKDIRKNTLTVSPKSPEGNLGGMVNEVTLKDCNWLITPEAGRTYHARTRYRQALQEVRITMPPSISALSPKTDSPQKGKREAEIKGVHNLRPRIIYSQGKIGLQFLEPQTVAPGQSLVLYDGDTLIGGGIIA